MTDDFDTLRPEIRDAVDSLDKSEGIDFAWLAVRAELLRLVGDLNATRLSSETFEAKYRCMRERAERAEAELAALKARIADSRTTDVFESEGHAGMVAMGGLPCEWIGKNVRLLVED